MAVIGILSIALVLTSVGVRLTCLKGLLVLLPRLTFLRYLRVGIIPTAQAPDKGH
jgi:hypothetical protein